MNNTTGIPVHGQSFARANAGTEQPIEAEQYDIEAAEVTSPQEDSELAGQTDSKQKDADRVRQRKNTLLKKAQEYVDAGFYIFPCLEKKPQESGWTTTPPTPDLDVSKIAESYSQFGVQLRDEHLLLDVDPRRFDESGPQLQMLLKELNIKLPPTFIVQTGGKPFELNGKQYRGGHVYFKKPADFKIQNGNLTLYPAIEVKTSGTQVIGAGSIHHETKSQYTVTSGSPSELAPAPQALLDFLQKAEYSKAPHSPKAVIEDDSEWNQQRGATYLSMQAPEAVEGNHGDATTYSVAAECRRFGLSEDTILLLMVEHYNPRCIPPWTSDDMADKVRSAFKFGQGAQGDKHPDWVFRDIGAEPYVKPQAVVRDDIYTKACYIAYLNTEKPVIEKERKSAFVVASRGKDYGLPQETTWKLIVECFDSRCQPSYGGEEWRNIVGQAYKDEEKTVGCEHVNLVPKSLLETDIGNALRFIRNYESRLRWVPQLGTWLSYEDGRWRQDTGERASLYAQETARSLQFEGRLSKKFKQVSASSPR